jgi:arsenate reductase (glutaredoxin)
MRIAACQPTAQSLLTLHHNAIIPYGDLADHQTIQFQIMITLYHNSRCSKSNAALALLSTKLGKHADTLSVIDYLETPLSVETLEALHRMLGGSVRGMMRPDEPEYKSLALHAPEIEDSQLYEAMASNPILLQRPIVVRDGRAVIGRPTEAIEALFA